MPTDAIVVLTHLPDRETALALAHKLIADGRAACVNVLGECTSVYRWAGKTESAQEVPMLIKTRESLYGAVEALICENHPYEVPEIIILPVAGGLPAYLDWVAAETLPPSP